MISVTIETFSQSLASTQPTHLYRQRCTQPWVFNSPSLSLREERWLLWCCGYTPENSVKNTFPTSRWRAEIVFSLFFHLFSQLRYPQQLWPHWSVNISRSSRSRWTNFFGLGRPLCQRYISNHEHHFCTASFSFTSFHFYLSVMSGPGGYQFFHSAA